MINSVIYSLKWVHDMFNYPDPIDNSYLTSLQKMAKRVARPKMQKKRFSYCQNVG